MLRDMPAMTGGTLKGSAYRANYYSQWVLPHQWQKNTVNRLLVGTLFDCRPD